MSDSGVQSPSAASPQYFGCLLSEHLAFLGCSTLSLIRDKGESLSGCRTHLTLLRPRWPGSVHHALFPHPECSAAPPPQDHGHGTNPPSSSLSGASSIAWTLPKEHSFLEKLAGNLQKTKWWGERDFVINLYGHC